MLHARSHAPFAPRLRAFRALACMHARTHACMRAPTQPTGPQSPTRTLRGHRHRSGRLQGWRPPGGALSAGRQHDQDVGEGSCAVQPPLLLGCLCGLPSMGALPALVGRPVARVHGARGGVPPSNICAVPTAARVRTHTTPHTTRAARSRASSTRRSLRRAWPSPPACP